MNLRLGPQTAEMNVNKEKLILSNFGPTSMKMPLKTGKMKKSGLVMIWTKQAQSQNVIMVGLLVTIEESCFLYPKAASQPIMKIITPNWKK